MLEFRILGPLEVLDDGTPVPLGGRNQRALLTLLLLRANEAVSTERLVDQLWGEHPPRTATTSLQNTVSQLRKLLGPGLLLTRPTATCSSWTATSSTSPRFERLFARRGRPSRTERACSCARRSALWRGPALADFELEDFAQTEIHRLEDLRLGVLEERISADLEIGVDADLVAELEALVRRHPLRERLRAQLMLALYRSGRQADALSAYHDARRTLVEELGIEPGPELQALYSSILRQERSLLRARAATLDDHYDEVMRAFAAGRLVPVLGPGAGGLAGSELATLACRALRALRGGSRTRVHLAGGRGAERDGPAPRRAPSRARPGGRAGTAPRVAGRATAAASRAWAAVPADRLDEFRHRRRAGVRAAEEELDVVVYIASGRDRGKFLHVAPEWWSHRGARAECLYRPRSRRAHARC